MHTLFEYAVLLLKATFLVGAVCATAALLLLRGTFGWNGWTPLLSVILFPAGALLALFLQALWLHQVAHTDGAELFDTPLAASASPVPAVTFMLAAFVTASFLWPSLKGVFGSTLASYGVFSLGMSVALGIGWFVGFMVASHMEGRSTGMLLAMGALMGTTSGLVSGLVAIVLAKGGIAQRRS
jgi:hypothetical protein